jgi:PAS domain-containing protein
MRNQVFFSIGVTILILRLVSERLHDELTESEERIIAEFQVANDAFAWFDRHDRFITANRRFLELT